MVEERIRGSARRALRIAVFAISVLVVLAVSLLGYVLYWPNTFPEGEEKALFVSKGETFAEVVDTLEAGGIVRSRMLFLLTADVLGGRSRIHVGKYLLKSGISNEELYHFLYYGRGIVPISVTIPEGLTIRRQARIFARHLGIDSSKYVQLADDTAFAHHLGFPDPSLEGYLLPDTYRFNWQTDERDILRELTDAFKHFFADSLSERLNDLHVSMRQAVTMASIVEGETHISDERPVIAGVYYNRLRIGMRLEADPTIQYLLDNGPRRLSYDDLKVDNPYNTYQHAGLPPGPINSPGRASILAALYPAHHQYLYFVANGKGGHWFSRTYDEHMRNVRMARRLRALAARTRDRSAGGSGLHQ